MAVWLSVWLRPFVYSLRAPTAAQPIVRFLGRSHPGELLSSWFHEGMLERLISKTDPVVKKLLTEAVVYSVRVRCG